MDIVLIGVDDMLVMVMIILRMVIIIEVLVAKCSNAISEVLKSLKRLKSFLCASHEVEFSSGDQR